MRKETLTLVNAAGRITGSGTRESCHTGKGKLHLAHLILLFNNKNEMLLQRRSRFKALWPGYWDGSAASHVLKGETLETSARRCLREELGIICRLRDAFTIKYVALYGKSGIERELCHILLGKHNGKVTQNPEHVSSWKWMKLEELQKDVERRPRAYTPWLRIAVEKLSATNAPLRNQ